MLEGKVKWFDKKKGYGFIACDGNSDVFVHYTSFSQAGLKTLNDGDRVFFEITAGEKGPRAQKVSLNGS
jgi:CspA family cold shock protein